MNNKYTGEVDIESPMMQPIMDQVSQEIPEMKLYRGIGGPVIINDGLGMDTEFVEWWTTSKEVAAQYGPTILEREISPAICSVIDAGGKPKNTDIMRQACFHGFAQHKAGRSVIAPLVIRNVVDDPEHVGPPITIVGFPKEFWRK